MKDIITRANINRGTFYLYYKDKFDLLDQTLSEVIQDIGASGGIVFLNDGVRRFFIRTLGLDKREEGGYKVMGLRKVYVDHAATTALSTTAFQAMLPYFGDTFANPSAIHEYGVNAKAGVERSRRMIAKAIGAKNNEIFFTSGGTESDNWAILGAVAQRSSKGKHIITTSIEHNAVLKTAEALEKQGYEVTYLPVDYYGRITPEQLAEAIREDTVLVSIMMANNEIGTILPIKDLCQVARQRNVLFHTDAVQAVGQVKIDVRDLNVDLLSMSAHKFQGPKGVGALFVKIGRILPPLIHGGGQEKGSRAGTENVPGIVGMAAALEEAVATMAEKNRKVVAMRDRLIQGILKIPGSYLTGDPENRLPGMASFAFAGMDKKPLVTTLSKAGILASSASACTAGSINPSRILLATGASESLAYGSLRISLNEHNSEEDMDYLLETIPSVISNMRNGD
ncbi:cysteine desulfurase family protein [Desulfosporosinus youngiae DSM 17734]|uniref:cysteine desulfurase n=1 Tax=Desulfosporosinus youngiae DSM 17734 TaxID=768710 RepID=H5XW56_9FIRM|nr:cysteine desulfurase family protein [Desulfosporosinus youngiae DSM 17734]